MININDYTSENLQDVVDEMESRIVELEAENKRLKENQRWRIVANGKLPKIGIPVLFLADWGSIYEGCTYDGKTRTSFSHSGNLSLTGIQRCAASSSAMRDSALLARATMPEK